MQASRRSVKAHQSFGSIGSSLSTGFQVYLSKCWDLYASPDCMVQRVFFSSFFAFFQHVDLVTTSLRAGFQVYRPGFSECRSREYDTICWELNMSSGFFTFLWLIVCSDGINKYGWCLAGGLGC